VWVYKGELHWVACASVVVCGASAVACGSQPAAPSESSTVSASSGAELRTGAALDLTAVSERSLSSFQRRSNAWVAAGRSHRLDVDNEGARLQTTLLDGSRDSRDRVRALLRARGRAAFEAARHDLGRSLRRSRSAPATLELRTTSIARVGYECVEGSPRVELGEAGSAERRFATCSEEWKNDGNQSEQSFRFDSKPAGSGELVVRISVSLGGAALDHVESDARGLRLVGTNASFRYGHGEWVDANGRRERIEARWAVDHIELRVPTALLENSSYPALLDPAIGPEIGTDAPVLVPSDFGHNPELASDGTGFLSVTEVNARIRAVRVNDAGRVLDADWLDFGTNDVTQLYPSVAFGGGHYLVTWSELKTDASGDTSDEIRGRFAKPDGTLEGSSSFVVSSGQAIYSSVGWDGQHFVLAYLGLQGNGVNNVRSVLLNPDGTRVAGSDHPLTTSGSASNPHLEVGATNTLVAWEEYVHSDQLGDTSTIHGARVGRDGSVLDAGGIALSNGTQSEQAPDVSSSGAGFLVAWQTDQPSVRGSIVSSAGAVSVKDVAISHSPDGAGLPSVAFDGTNYLVGWTDNRDEQSLYGVNVSPAGVVGSQDKKLASDAPRYVAFGSDHTNLAWNGSHFLLSYLGGYPNGLEGSLIGKDLAVVLSPIALTPIPNSQGYPRAAFDGTNYVVAWTDQRVSNTDMSVRAVRISQTGSVLDSNGIAVSPDDKPAFGFELASGGHDSTLFVWSATDHNPQQRMLAGNGSLADVKAFTTTNDVFVPSMASNKGGYLTAFNTGSSSATGSVYGHLLDASGNAGAEFRIDASTLNTGPFVFPSEGQYLVAYAKSGMHLVTISSTGTIGTPVDLTSNVTLVGGASNDTNTLVTWNQGDMDKNPLFGRFLHAGAYVGSAFEISPESAGYASTVGWDGETYWAVWESPTHALLTRSIGSNGTLGPVSTLVSEEVYAPVLTSGGQGQLLLSYAKLAGERRSYRVISRLVGRGADIPPGGAGGSSGGGQASGGVAGGGTASGGTTTTGSGGATTGGMTSGASGGVAGSSTANGGTTTTGSGGATSGGATSGGSAQAGAGGSTQPPVSCSVQHVGARGSASGFGTAFGLALAAAAIRRRRANVRG